ncbi:MAG: sulfatase-like hydrolase/transferase [Gemmatimonadota bacterium]|nr:sulfatase-like hydrolase/transferase [Gemmatimonadota bacterium]
MSRDKPNILFFFTDDQRFDTINALGNPLVHTPAMDRLVARGVSLTHAHIPGGTSAAICMPSRAMLHTGRTLFHLDGAGADIPPEHTLMGEYLRSHGYRTWGTGKWHNGVPSYARSFSDGAEIFFGGMDDHWNVPVFDYDPEGKYEGTLPQCPDAFRSNEVNIRKGNHVHAGRHSSEIFADCAVEWLKGYDSEDPFFMYVSFMAPHDPRTMPREFLDLYDPEAIPLPKNFMGGHPFDNGDLKVRDEVLETFPRDPASVRRHIAEYYAMISHLDAQMGRVMQVLEDRGMADDTIVVFAGDNGLAIGQHGLFGKQNMYEHSIRVPLVFSGPGIPCGVRRSAYAYLLDIFPTLCDLTGLDTPGSVEGVSLAPTFDDPAARPRDTVFAAYRQWQRMVKDDRYKLIEYVVCGCRTTQLFDLERDPLECRNLAGEAAHADRLAALRSRLFDWRDEWGDADSEWGRAFWTGYDA